MKLTIESVSPIAYTSCSHAYRRAGVNRRTDTRSINCEAVLARGWTDGPRVTIRDVEHDCISLESCQCVRSEPGTRIRSGARCGVVEVNRYLESPSLRARTCWSETGRGSIAPESECYDGNYEGCKSNLGRRCRRHLTSRNHEKPLTRLQINMNC